MMSALDWDIFTRFEFGSVFSRYHVHPSFINLSFVHSNIRRTRYGVNNYFAANGCSNLFTRSGDIGDL